MITDISPVYFVVPAVIAFAVSWYVADDGNGPFSAHVSRLLLAIFASVVVIFFVVLLTAVVEAYWTENREGFLWAGVVALGLSALSLPASVLGCFIGVLVKGGLK